jgi:CelD/BcsL family acetyltransferase involved in cellulose biosynthesis
MNEMQSAIDAAQGRRGAKFAPIAAMPERQSAAVSGIRIRVLDDLAAAEPAWRRLEADGEGTVFQTFDLAAAWQRTLGSAARHAPAFVTLSHAGKPIALLPFAVGGGPLRRLTWLGQQLFDYLGPLLAPDFQRLVAPAQFAALWHEIRALLQQDARFRHDLIELRRMPREFGAQPNPFVSLPLMQHPSNGYVAMLRGDWDEFYRTHRTAKARKQDRSKLRRLQELGAVELFTAGTCEEVERLVRALFEQKVQTFRRKGIDPFFRQPGCREFFVALSRGTGKHTVHASALRVGNDLAAVNFAVEYRGRYSLLQVSYDEKYARYSPGAIHLNELFRYALGRDLNEFDFLVGAQRLKQEWSDREIPLFDLVAPATVRGALPAALARLLTAIKRGIKQNRLAWDAFQRLRAAVGALRGVSRR